MTDERPMKIDHRQPSSIPDISVGGRSQIIRGEYNPPLTKIHQLGAAQMASTRTKDAPSYFFVRVRNNDKHTISKKNNGPIKFSQVFAYQKKAQKETPSIMLEY